MANHNCLINAEKQIKCWGYNSDGQLGLGDTNNRGDQDDEMGEKLPFVQLGSGLIVDSIVMGWVHTCAYFTSNAIKCWGDNTYGHLGLGDTNDRGDEIDEMGDKLPTVDLGTVSYAINVVCGTYHTCVLFHNKKVKCFGTNYYGQLGYQEFYDNKGVLASDMGDNLDFVNLGTDIEVESLHTASTTDHNCIIIVNSQLLKCWGSNSQGHLGYGDTYNRGNYEDTMGDFLPTVDLGDEDRVKHVGLGYFSTCALRIDDVLKCWGLNGNGQLGAGSTNAIISMGNDLASISYDSGKVIKQISGGGDHMCILYDDNLTVKCIGANDKGQLGQGDTIQRGSTSLTLFPSFPAIDFGISKLTILNIQAMQTVTCVTFANYGVKCFGNGEYARLGYGNTINIGDEVGEMGMNLPYVDVFKTSSPTTSPTFAPSFSPSTSPSKAPVTETPTKAPTFNPTTTPTNSPSKSPSWNPTTQLPTKNPSKAPTNAPSSSPSSSPTNVLTIKPTLSPNKTPTKSPVNKAPTKAPARNPTKNPTRKPTAYGFFGPNESSLPFGTVKAFDLYLLIDTTRNYAKNDVYCIQYKLISGASPSSCFDLMMDYAIEIVKSISISTNGYYSNDLSKGLRVQASLIQCIGTTKTPSSTTLFTLTGDSSIIMNGLNNARTNTKLDVAASCPLQGLYDVIQKIENEWSSVNNRPYKAIITLTDAVVNDATNPGVRLIDVVSGIRYRCTPSIVIVPYKMTDTSTQALNQQLSLKILTGNVDASVFEAKNAPWIVIPKIGEQITSLLISSNARCSSSTSFSTADKYWCGYNTRALCMGRTSCDFVVGPGCQKKQSQSGCVYGDQSSCESNSQCQWTSNTCTRKPEEPDCNALVLQTSCNNKSSFCSWNGSGCIANTIG